VLPEGYKDADELVSVDVSLWKQAIQEAKYIVDYLFERFEHDFDLESAVGKRGYADRLSSTLRRLGDPVEQDHYVKLLAGKVGVSEEAIRAKLEADTPDTGGALPATSGAHQNSQPVRRAVVQATGKPSVRVLHEESFLALNLMYPACRASLADLSAVRFSSDERKAAFELLLKHKTLSGTAIAAKAGELGPFVQKLLLVSEEEYSEGEEMALQQEAFLLARKVFLESNKQFKDQLGIAVAEAEKTGNEDERLKLMNRLSAIIDSER
jgi:DNA primase